MIWKSSLNLNEISVKISIKYQWKSIGNPVEISMSYGGLYLALCTMPNMLTPLVNEQILGKCIIGIVYNAKYADTTGE